MIIKIGFDIQFELAGPTPMILMLYVHPSRQADLRTEEEIVAEPNIPLTDFTDLYGNRCARVLAPAGNIRFTLEALIEDSGQPDEKIPTPSSIRSKSCLTTPCRFFTQPLLRSRQAIRHRLETFRRHRSRLAARRGDLQLGP